MRLHLTKHYSTAKLKHFFCAQTGCLDWKTVVKIVIFAGHLGVIQQKNPLYVVFFHNLYAVNLITFV